MGVDVRLQFLGGEANGTFISSHLQNEAYLSVNTTVTRFCSQSLAILNTFTGIAGATNTSLRVK